MDTETEITYDIDELADAEAAYTDLLVLERYRVPFDLIETSLRNALQR